MFNNYHIRYWSNEARFASDFSTMMVRLKIGTFSKMKKKLMKMTSFAGCSLDMLSQEIGYL
jgi:hypothetical protein